MKTYIDFKPARCRDCYLCLKSCPVKAIRLTGRQARIIQERCIQCGACANVCPQDAKTVHSGIPEVKALLASGKTVLASVAPSFVSSFSLNSFEPMRQALLSLGFSDAEETAIGAAAVTAEYARLLESGQYKNLISSACPAVNRMIQMYYPQALKYLAPVVSPMEAHARILKQRCPDAAVVFVGPCIAKMREADEGRHVDAVLTFQQLEAMLAGDGRSIAPEPEPAPVSGPSYGAGARLYSTESGIVRSFPKRPPNYAYMAASGNVRVAGVLGRLDSLDHAFLELHACPFGCVNGPESTSGASNALAATQRVRNYAMNLDAPCPENVPDLSREYPRILDTSVEPTEEQMRKLLSIVGKKRPEDEINCGSCGYKTCRDKAWAAFNGYADENLCVPYMRMQADSVSAEVLRRLPYGILVLDSAFRIDSINETAAQLLGIDMNLPAGESLFDYLMIPEFLIADNTGEDILDKRIEVESTGKVLLMSVMLMKDQNQLLGVFKDVTEESSYNDRLREMRQRTFKVTDEVVKKQMRIAQEIASLLGETTAETKVALIKLKDILRDSD